MDAKLQEMKESMAALEVKYKELRADMPMDDKMNKMMDYFYDSMSRMRDYMWEMEGNMYRNLEKHTNPAGATHAPHLKTASQVQAYCDSCNMTDDVEVVKPQIHIRANRQGNKEFSIDLNLK